jgi:hypothetical protein
VPRSSSRRKLLDFITPLTYGKKYNSWRPSWYNFLHPSLTFSPFCSHLLITLFLNTLSLYSSLLVFTLKLPSYPVLSVKYIKTNKNYVKINEWISTSGLQCSGIWQKRV